MALNAYLKLKGQKQGEIKGSGLSSPWPDVRSRCTLSF